MSERTIVVTGGFGFIGSRFVLKLLSNKENKVIIIDKMSYAADAERVYGEATKEELLRLTVIEKDIQNVTSKDIANAEYVVNFAAETHVANSIANGRPFIESNILGLFNLLEVSRRSQTLKKFVQISTDEVYGDMADRSGVGVEAKETDILHPSSYYSATKAAGDLMVQAVGRTYGLPYIITRCCNNFGLNQHQEKMLPLFFEQMCRGEDITLHGDGTPSREWIHADDHALYISALMYSEMTNEIFNIGTGYRYTNATVAKMMLDLNPSSRSKITYIKDRPGQDMAYRLDSSKVHEYVGEICPIPLESFLEEEYGE